jgi:hypothetical protein
MQVNQDEDKHTDDTGQDTCDSYTEASCRKSEISNIYWISELKKVRCTKQPGTTNCTSPHGGQSPSQQRRLQACRPQSLILWHFLSHAKSW